MRTDGDADRHRQDLDSRDNHDRSHACHSHTDMVAPWLNRYVGSPTIRRGGYLLRAISPERMVRSGSSAEAYRDLAPWVLGWPSQAFDLNGFRVVSPGQPGP
jgi:hypothetical protein